MSIMYLFTFTPLNVCYFEFVYQNNAYSDTHVRYLRIFTTFLIKYKYCFLNKNYCAFKQIFATQSEVFGQTSKVKQSFCVM